VLGIDDAVRRNDADGSEWWVIEIARPLDVLGLPSSAGQYRANSAWVGSRT
jgi:hypothetical protein